MRVANTCLSYSCDLKNKGLLERIKSTADVWFLVIYVSFLNVFQ